jgi:hypothetical protein
MSVHFLLFREGSLENKEFFLSTDKPGVSFIPEQDPFKLIGPVYECQAPSPVSQEDSLSFKLL